MWGLLYPQSYLAGGRRIESCWSMGTKTFAVFEGIPQECIFGSADEWQIEEQMKQAQGITEQLKADNAWEWVGRMNNIQACAREIADKEIIYR